MTRVTLFVALCLTLAGNALAQGVQTGTIRGLVTDQQDLALRDVSVTVTSPAIQGSRTAKTDARGLYAIPGLPAGDYDVRFELQGFASATRAATVPLGLSVALDVPLGVARVETTIDVVAGASAPVENPIVGSNFKKEEIDALPTPRTLEGIAQFSLGANENSPNGGQMTINGGFGFDNAFLINGVDVTDNVFATPQNLFVEDAIQETQVLTSGVSAEFGRFGGGVVNAVTKSGGNTFSGSGRLNFLNPAWTTATPFEVSKGIEHLDRVSRIYEGTFGGPLAKDRLWFFVSGRYGETSNQVTLQQTGIGLTSVDTDKRGEVKLTGTFAKNHTLQGGFFNDPRSTTNASGAQSLIIDPHSEDSVSFPNWYVFTNYRGVLENQFFVEAQYSERRFENRGGGTGTDLVHDSPFVGTCFCTLYNAPYFDATDLEQRNNRQLTGSATTFWSLSGQHATKAGYEFYRSQRTGGGSQSPTSYVFGADYLTDAAGAPVLDGTGRPTPVFVPGRTYISYFPAVRGAVMNNDSHSLYVQDHWTINRRWSADLGARFEHATIASTGGLVSISNNRIVPRLAVAYALEESGDKVVHVTYGQYSSRYNEVQLGRNSPVGNAPEIDSVYRGPAGQGFSFAPGFNLSNYPVSQSNSSVSDPTQNVFIAPGTKSPLTHEFTLSYGENLRGGKGYAEVSYVARTTHDLIEDFQTRAGGTTDVTVNGVAAGTFTNIVYANTDLAHRQYQAMIFQSRYRIRKGWSLAGHYTLQLQNEGNFEGEATNVPGNPSAIGSFPEAFNAARNYPDGRLQSFERSRLRIWSTYDWNLGRYGDLLLSGLWRVDSARVYSLVATNQPLTSIQASLVASAGYPDAPSSLGNQVFFDARGSESFKGYGLLDTSINYSIPVMRSLRPWLKLEVFNLFDNQKLIAWNTSVSQNTAAGVDALGLATSYTKGSTFGTATGNTVTNLGSRNIPAYPVAIGGATAGGRTVRLAVGFRF
jgi:hypothetical protein